MSAINIEGLTKRFKERIAVDSLCLSIDEGEVFALLGPNGAGKTTTIKMLCALLVPSCGDALLMGHSVTKDPAAVKQIINVSPQETAIAPKLTVKENLVMIAGIYGASKREAEKRANEMLAAFGLTDRAKERARKLSGGLQRRLSIAMALISDPKILFLDEPTLGLDVRARRDLWNLIAGLKGRTTIILTTHSLEEAEALAERIGIMNRGKMQIVGSLESILAQSGMTTLEEAFLALTDEEAIA